MANVASMTEAQREQAAVAFAYFDKSQDGRISVPELKSALTALGFDADGKTVIQMIDSIDVDCSGYIDFNEWLDMLAQNTQRTPATVDELFDLVADSDGSIRASTLMSLAQELQIDLPPMKAAAMVALADSDRSGAVSRFDFHLLMDRQ